MVMQFYKAVIGLVTVLEEPNSKNLTRLLKNSEVGFIQQRMLLLLRKNSEIEIELGKRVAMLNKANILTLQSQMNPHFIINVLNLVSSLSIAENGYDTDMVKCISKLSEMLRIAMDSSKQLISLEEEIHYLEQYLYITNMRFKDRFTIDWHIDDTTRSLLVVKMTLQPIVENAFHHGAFREGDIGIIAITTEQCNNMLVVHVYDNGDGISPEALSVLQRQMNEEKLEKEHSMGLYNVNQRIKLLFGEEYGCSIASDHNGTIVTIRYPIMTE